MRVSVSVKFKEALNKTLSKDLYKTLVIDILTLGVILILFTIYAIALTSVSQTITGGASLQTIQTAIGTLNEQEISALTASLQRFLAVLIVGALLVLAASLFIFSFSRAYLWHSLRQDPLTKKEVMRWVLLTIVLCFGSGFLFLIFLLIKMLFLLFFSSLVVSMIIDALFIIVLLLLLFTIFFEFVKTRQVFFAIGNAFTLIRHHLKPIGLLLILFLGIGFLFSLILQGYQRNYFLAHTQLTQTLIISAITLLYIAFVRLFYTKSVLEQ